MEHDRTRHDDRTGRDRTEPAHPQDLTGLLEHIRRKLVAVQLDQQLLAHFPAGRPLRVLDVGMGRGTQALRLARTGHRVTGVEGDGDALADARLLLTREPKNVRQRLQVVEGDGHDTGVHFLPGAFDVVLCHDVLMRTKDPEPLLAGLARMLAPGGLLSLVVRNGDAPAMRPGLGGDWRGALAALDGLPDPDGDPGGAGGSSAAETHAERLATLTATLAGHGAPLRAWYGVRVFTDRAPSGTVGPGDFAALLAVEERAGRTDPYRGVAAMLHLCGVRG